MNPSYQPLKNTCCLIINQINLESEFPLGFRYTATYHSYLSANIMQKLVLSFLLISCLTACGQKGDLYLPQKNIPNNNLPEKGA
jgi:predicted small lipoprotein YifL